MSLQDNQEYIVNSDEENCDDEIWEQVYSKEFKNIEKLGKGYLYQTYGGGPSGGFFITRNKEVFSWHQRSFKRIQVKFMFFKTDKYGFDYIKCEEGDDEGDNWIETHTHLFDDKDEGETDQIFHRCADGLCIETQVEI